MIKAVFFDLGCTLVDIATFLIKYADEVDLRLLKSLGFDVTLEKVKRARRKTEEEIETKYKNNSEKHRVGLFFFHFCKNLGFKIDMKTAVEKDDKFWEEWILHMKLLPNAVKILNYLRATGFKLAIICNGNKKRTHQILDRLGIKDYFDLVVASEMVGKEKCTSLPIKYALEKLRLKPKEAVMVGDRKDEDIIGAYRLGMKTIRVDYGFGAPMHGRTKEADYVIDDLIKLKDVLKLLNK